MEKKQMYMLIAGAVIMVITIIITYILSSNKCKECKKCEVCDIIEVKQQCPNYQVWGEVDSKCIDDPKILFKHLDEFTSDGTILGSKFSRPASFYTIFEVKITGVTTVANLNNSILYFTDSNTVTSGNNGMPIIFCPPNSKILTASFEFNDVADPTIKKVTSVSSTEELVLNVWSKVSVIVNNNNISIKTGDSDRIVSTDPVVSTAISDCYTFSGIPDALGGENKAIVKNLVVKSI